MIFMLLHDGREVHFPERGDERQGANDDGEGHVSIPGGLKNISCNNVCSRIFFFLPQESKTYSAASLPLARGAAMEGGRAALAVVVPKPSANLVFFK